jgi:hypothetical protein
MIVYHYNKETPRDQFETIRAEMAKASDRIKNSGQLIHEVLFNVEKPRFKDNLLPDIENNLPPEIEKMEVHKFMKEFVISNSGMGKTRFEYEGNIKKAHKLISAYDQTAERLCANALAYGASPSLSINGVEIDLRTHDGEPLFSNNHKLKNGETQSNILIDRLSTEDEIKKTVKNVVSYFKTIKAEDGAPLGYDPDTIIIPCDRIHLEKRIKNLIMKDDSFAGWTVVTLPGWYSTVDQIMIMSSEANRDLHGNIFFNRVPLIVSNWVDNHTGNYQWNGRCRFGVGFGTYKHICAVLEKKDSIMENEGD